MGKLHLQRMSNTLIVLKQEADAEWEKAAALTKKAQELSHEAQVLESVTQLL